jgi:hypothetical protein
MYHPRLFHLCLDELCELSDLLTCVVVAKYELQPVRLRSRFDEEHIFLTDFRSLCKRLQENLCVPPNGTP